MGYPLTSSPLKLNELFILNIRWLTLLKMADPLSWMGDDNSNDNLENDNNFSNTTTRNASVEENSASTISSASSCFGSQFDFSTASRTCQWPSIVRAPELKHFRVKLKFGDQSEKVLVFYKNKYQEIFKTLAGRYN